jgi:hypothetical protein
VMPAYLDLAGSGGQSGRTCIGLPPSCTVGAAELACPPAEGRMAFLSIDMELPVLPVVWPPAEVVAGDCGVQFVSDWFGAADVCASAGVAASIANRPAAARCARIVFSHI